VKQDFYCTNAHAVYRGTAVYLIATKCHILTLCGLTSQKTHRGGLGLGGSVHEEAHPLFPLFYSILSMYIILSIPVITVCIDDVLMISVGSNSCAPSWSFGFLFSKVAEQDHQAWVRTLTVTEEPCWWMWLTPTKRSRVSCFYIYWRTCVYASLPLAELWTVNLCTGLLVEILVATYSSVKHRHHY